MSSSLSIILSLLTRYLSYRFPLSFFFTDPATTEIYTLSLHDALPIYALLQAGEALWALNRRAAAVALWQRGVRAHGQEDQGLRARLGLALLDMGQNEAALETLEAAARAHRDPHIVREAARAALALGRLDRAAEHLQAVIDQNPNDAEARFMFGLVRDRQGQPEAALTFYRLAARVEPNEGRYLAAAADALHATGKEREAQEAMQ